MSSEKNASGILLVEDDRATRNLLRALLLGEGYRVFVASDGASALAAMRNEVPDLAIIDLHLPDISGIELASLLQPEVPFLAFTVDESEQALQTCIEKGALGYLVKPMAAEPFLRHVQVALERGRDQRNLRRALKDNRLVNTALGVLMGYWRLSEPRAFDALMAYTTARNLKTFDVSTRIVAAINALSAETGVDHVATEARLFLDEFGSVLLKGDR
ncbi:MAG TPA: response regulator [Candidatus Competibacter phosphatis]|nr:response regulator [Candidatus Competibacter phosphatis]